MCVFYFVGCFFGVFFLHLSTGFFRVLLMSRQVDGGGGVGLSIFYICLFMYIDIIHTHTPTHIAFRFVYGFTFHTNDLSPSPSALPFNAKCGEYEWMDPTDGRTKKTHCVRGELRWHTHTHDDETHSKKIRRAHENNNRRNSPEMSLVRFGTLMSPPHVLLLLCYFFRDNWGGFDKKFAHYEQY